MKLLLLLNRHHWQLPSTSLRQLPTMPVITRCEVGIYALQEFDGWLVIRVLRYEFAVNGEVEDFAFGLFDCVLQIGFALLYLVNQGKPFSISITMRCCSERGGKGIKVFTIISFDILGCAPPPPFAINPFLCDNKK